MTFQKGGQHSQLSPERQQPNRTVSMAVGLSLFADGSVDCNRNFRYSGLCRRRRRRRLRLRFSYYLT